MRRTEPRQSSTKWTWNSSISRATSKPGTDKRKLRKSLNVNACCFNRVLLNPSLLLPWRSLIAARSISIYPSACHYLIACVIGICVSGCAHPSTRYALVEDSLRIGDTQRAVQIIEQAEREYGPESRLLYDMDRGMTLHVAGQYQASNTILDQAEDEVERLYTRRATSETKAFLTNDSKLPYEGDPYEQTMINVIKALNYAAMG